MQLPATESEIATLENPRFWHGNRSKVKEKKDWKAGLGGDPNPIVSYFENSTVLSLQHSQLNSAARLSVLDRIIEEVHDYLLQA